MDSTWKIMKNRFWLKSQQKSKVNAKVNIWHRVDWPCAGAPRICAGAQWLGFRTQIVCLLHRGAMALRRGAITGIQNPDFLPPAPRRKGSTPGRNLLGWKPSFRWHLRRGAIGLRRGAIPCSKTGFYEIDPKITFPYSKALIWIQ
jgi:hypothetical protein